MIAEPIVLDTSSSSLPTFLRAPTTTTRLAVALVHYASGLLRLASLAEMTGVNTATTPLIQVLCLVSPSSPNPMISAVCSSKSTD